MALKGKKILIVDDELGIRELLSEILMDEGYSVITAHDAQSAWDIRNREDLDLILLDIWMPDVDGFSLYKQWRDANLANLPVIIMSGHATVDTAVEATRLGAIEVLEKPIAIHRLLGAIEKGLSKIKSVTVHPILTQMNFGSSIVARRFKKDLMEAYATEGHVLLVGAANSGSAFFAQFLAHPKGKITVIEDGGQVENKIQKLLHNAKSEDLFVIRLVDVYNPYQLSGLTGFLREARKKNVRVVVCSIDSLDALKEKMGFSEILMSMLSRCVVTLPRLSACHSDLEQLIGVICRHFRNAANLHNSVLTPDAIAVLTQHVYEDDFMELISIIRSALLYAQDGKVDAQTIRVIINQFSRHTASSGLGDDIYNLPLREAREKFEREYFTRLINITNGNMQKAAQKAALDRTYFYRKLKQYRAEINLENLSE